MSARRHRQSGSATGPKNPARPDRTDISAQPTDYQQMDRRVQIGVLIVALILVCAVVIGADFVLGAISGQEAAPSAAPSATPTRLGIVIPGNGGHWTIRGQVPAADQ